MFSKLYLALLALSVSSALAAPTRGNSNTDVSNQATCDASGSVITKTVTVTASAVATNVAASGGVSNTSGDNSSGSSSSAAGSSASNSNSGSSSSSKSGGASSSSKSGGASSSSNSGSVSSNSSGSSATSSGSTGSDTNDNSSSGAAVNNAGTGAATPNNATAAGSSGSTATAGNGGTATASNATASGATATTGNGNAGTATQGAAGSLSSTDITQNATENNPDAQSSLTLDPRVIATGFMNNGQDVQEAGQVASLTSNNNFINYCLTQGNLPITNGKQIQTGSCNPAPIGSIPSVQNMPSAKFSNPANGANVTANTAFTITLNINNLDTGNFVNANENYFAAPQQLNSQGQIFGHTHVVIEALSDLGQTTPTNPQEFAFFKGVNTAAQNGAVSAAVTNGVPAGSYRLCSINSSSNHQPVIVAIAQHGSLDDCVYFTATGGAAENPATANEAGPAAESAAAASAAASAAGAGATANAADASSVASAASTASSATATKSTKKNKN